MNYILEIGKTFDLEKGEVPAKTLEVSTDELHTLLQFAKTRVGQDLNTIYTLNDIDFLVKPKI